MSNRFIMLVGLPGSGKSDFANSLQGWKVHSSDKLREDLFGDENDQSHNDELFEELHRRIKEDLSVGKNVVYDATNINKKRRISFLKEIKRFNCEKECVLVLTPYNSCMCFNTYRTKVVPKEVIDRMYKNFQPPHKSEGWDKITIYQNFSNAEIDNMTLYNLFEGENNINNFDQKNSHHLLTLGMHCQIAGCYIVGLTDDKLLETAALLHDIGKVFTQSKLNSKGEDDGDYHYYQHHCVGAYDSLFYTYNMGYTTEEMLHVSNLIYYHMHPYMSWKQSEKAREKDRKILGDNMIREIDILHKADAFAH